MIVELLLFYMCLVMTGALSIYLRNKAPSPCSECGDTVKTTGYDNINGTTIKVKVCRNCKKRQ
jgi:hypothetical protein